MTPADETRDRLLRRLPEALARYVVRLSGKPVGRSLPPVYCGHLGDQANLEVYLWKLVNSLQDAGDELLPNHVLNCPYCLSRIYGISKSLRFALEKYGEPLWQPVTEPAAIELVVKRARRTVQRAKETVLAEVLVAVDGVGKWLSGGRESWVFLCEAPAWRGFKGAAAERAVVGQGSEVQSLRVSGEVEGLTISAEIAASGAHPELVVRCLVTGTNDRPPGRFQVEWSIDDRSWGSAELDAAGSARMPLPDRLGTVQASVSGDTGRIGVARVTMQTPA